MAKMTVIERKLSGSLPVVLAQAIPVVSTNFTC